MLMQRLFFIITMIVCSSGANGSVLYYNDGTNNDFIETWGDVEVGYEWNRSFDPGGFMDGTSDDIPPYNTIDNKGIATLQGAAGGVAGGGLRIQVAPTVGAAGKKGAIIVPYGSQAQKKQEARAKWRAKFKKIGEANGVDATGGKEIWRDQGIDLGNGKISKLVNYIGDPLVSIPPVDLSLAELSPFDDIAVGNAVLDDNVLVFFWDVTGTKEMDILDILIGDFELNSGYEDVLHHFPYISILDDVSPVDFGILAQDANMIEFNGDRLSGSSFTGSMFISVSDPAVVPVPASLWLFGSGLIGLIGMRKKSSKTL